MKPLDKKDPLIAYFGFGALASTKLIGALLKRVPEHEAATVKNFETYVQSWEAIPEHTRVILAQSWKQSDHFVRYVLHRKRGSTVEGVVWYLTQTEFEIIGEFEIDDRWMNLNKIIAVTTTGRQVLAYTHTLDHWSNDLIPISVKKTFLNKYRKMLLVGRYVRGLCIPSSKTK